MEFIENLFYHQRNTIEELDLCMQETSDVMTNLFKTFEELGSQNTDNSEPKDIVQKNNLMTIVDDSEPLLDLDEFNSILNDCDGSFASVDNVKSVLGSDGKRSLLNTGFYFSDAKEPRIECLVKPEISVPIPILIDYDWSLHDLVNHTVKNNVAQCIPDPEREKSNKCLCSEGISYYKEQTGLIKELKQDNQTNYIDCDTLGISDKCKNKLESDNTNIEHMTSLIPPALNVNVHIQALTEKSTNLSGFCNDFDIKYETNDVNNEFLNAEITRELKYRSIYNELSVYSSVDNLYKGCFDVISISSTAEDETVISNLKIYKNDTQCVKNKDPLNISNDEDKKQITTTDYKYGHTDPINFKEELDSEYCSGYNSSDFEFITEIEAELKGIVKSSLKKKLKTKLSKSKNVSKKDDIIKDDTEISPKRSIFNNVDKDVAGHSKVSPTNNLQLRTLPNLEITSEHDNMNIAGPRKVIQINNLKFRTKPDSKMTSEQDAMDSAELSEVISANNSKFRTPDSKIISYNDIYITEPRKVILTNNLKFRTKPETNSSENDIRNNYTWPTQDHRIPAGEDYLNLFRGNYNPALSFPNVIFLKNKSIQRTYMHVKFDGLGFDLRTTNGNYSCNDETKYEASECAKRILSMYPADNKRRKRL